MHFVVYRSSGIVAFSTTSKASALEWLKDNNYDDKGRCLELYELKKGKRK